MIILRRSFMILAVDIAPRLLVIDKVFKCRQFVVFAVPVEYGSAMS